MRTLFVGVFFIYIGYSSLFAASFGQVMSNKKGLEALKQQINMEVSVG